VLVLFHPHVAAAKGYALGFQAHALLQAGFAGQADFSAGS
jgi:hypothetical protein